MPPASPIIHLLRRYSRAMSRIFLLFLIATLAACGGPTEQVTLTPRRGIEWQFTAPERYAMSLRMAALARIETRAGQDELAAEYYRAAYHLHQSPALLIGYGQSVEKAKLFAEARDAAELALTFDMSEAQRKLLEDNLKRLSALVPPGLHRVAILVQPYGARVELNRAGRNKLEGPQRVLLGSGDVFLAPGTWNIESSAKGYNSELRTFQVGGPEGNTVAIALTEEESGPMLVGTPNAKPGKIQEKHDVLITPEPKADPVPNKVPEKVPLPDIKPEPDKVPIVPPKLVIPEDKPQDTETGLIAQAPPRSGKSFLHAYGPVTVSALGAAALLAGGWFGLQTRQNAQDVKTLSPGTLSFLSDQTTLISSAQDNSKLANYCFVGGGLLIAAGTAWWILGPSAHPPATTGDAAPPTLWQRISAVPQFSVAPTGFSAAWIF